jgi:aryl-alcohol dehydrogenase-like predicted oxidoreductase
MEDDQLWNPVFQGIELGIGTWAWGDRLIWDYGKEYQDKDIQEAFEISINAGAILFDTAEVYGQGKSEQLLGQFIKQTDLPVRIATKFMPYPWRLSKRSLIKALKKSLQRLGLEKVDLYQIHMPLPPVTLETWMEALTIAYQEGLVSAVGVSNYDLQQTQRAIEALSRNGIPLASNQVEYHLLNRKVEKDGLVKYCLENGIALIAYSPLAMGLLTGKYTPENMPRGVRGGRVRKEYLRKIQPLILEMRRIGASHAGKNAAQVAINWLICKGCLPIPGAKNREQAEENVLACGWRLSDDEIIKLEQLSDQIESEN